MATTTEMMQALEKVMDPELGRSIVDLGMVKDLVQDETGKVSFTLALTIMGCPLKNHMANDAKRALGALPGVTEVEVNFGELSKDEKDKLVKNLGHELPKINAFNKIKRVIAVMSGKGGVGKSSVTSMLAVELRRQGLNVGILDADITGPSIPRMFGLESGGLKGSEQGILPGITGSGIRVVSTNLLIRDENAPVVWRGPLISGAIKQFWTDVLWGKLDVLLVDMPPGTADAALTVMQSLPIDGVVMVTTPQMLAGMVVHKAVNMLKQMNKPVVGVVENMSYFICPDCNSKHEIFGPSNVASVADAAGLSDWVRLPLDKKVTEKCDAGRVEEVDTELVKALAQQIAAMPEAA